MKQKIKVNIDSTYKYLQLWNGIFNLTNTELTILSYFIDADDLTITENFCDMKNKIVVARLAGMKDPNTLNNYIKKFKDKGVISKIKGEYKLNKLLNPNTSTIEININK
tara:strand:- start:1627 stop:1953 length:327 start_codon:yes stop_codon:yes gene_type:complete